MSRLPVMPPLNWTACTFRFDCMGILYFLNLLIFRICRRDRNLCPIFVGASSQTPLSSPSSPTLCSLRALLRTCSWRRHTRSRTSNLRIQSLRCVCVRLVQSRAAAECQHCATSFGKCEVQVVCVMMTAPTGQFCAPGVQCTALVTVAVLLNRYMAAVKFDLLILTQVSVSAIISLKFLFHWTSSG